MIAEYISDLARQLVVLNASWLSEIRSIGYAQSVDGAVIITDGENEIGISDRDGNSGYIRFSNDRNFTVEEIPRYRSCSTSSRYNFFLRLVIVAKTDTPENLSLLIATQINSLEFSGDNARARVTGGGSHSAAITRTEGGEQLNTAYRVVYADFTFSFDYRDNCVQIPITMACDNCTTTYDIGCIQHCSEIELEQVSAYTGTATLNTFFNGTVVSQSFSVTTGEAIVVPMDGLNEDYEYNIQLRDADGEVIDLTFGSPVEDYDCFKIKLLP